MMKRARKLALALISPNQWPALLKHRLLAGNEHWAALSPDIRAVIDIGANRGQFALAARTRLPQARIDSFEPLPSAAKVFRAVFSGDPGTRLHECAVGARRAVLPMNLSAREDSSSLLPIAAAHSRHYPGTDTVGTIEVQVLPLAEVIPPGTLPQPALLKIDVQGAEFDTLVGCESLLPELTYIYCECSFVVLFQGQRLATEIIAWLSERGFALVDVHNVDRDPGGLALQADLLFRRRTPA